MPRWRCKRAPGLSVRTRSPGRNPLAQGMLDLFPETLADAPQRKRAFQGGSLAAGDMPA